MFSRVVMKCYKDIYFISCIVSYKIFHNNEIANDSITILLEVMQYRTMHIQIEEFIKELFIILNSID